LGNQINLDEIKILYGTKSTEIIPIIMLINYKDINLAKKILVEWINKKNKRGREKCRRRVVQQVH
jgi:hypothetical protein